MAIVNKFNVNKQQVTLNADIIENMSANDVSYNDSFQYDENTVGDKLNKLSELEAKTDDTNRLEGEDKVHPVVIKATLGLKIDGTFTSRNARWAQVDVSKRTYLYLDFDFPTGLVANASFDDWAFFGDTLNIISHGKYDVIEGKVRFDIPEGAVSFGYAVQPTATTDSTLVYLCYAKGIDTKDNERGLLKLSSFKEFNIYNSNGVAVNCHYNASTGAASNAYIRTSMAKVAVPTGAKKVSVPLVPSIVTSTLNYNLTTTPSLVFLDANNAIISFKGCMCGEVGTRVWADIPDNAVQIAATYLTDSECANIGEVCDITVPTFSQLGGMILYSQDIEAIREKALKNSAVLGFDNTSHINILNNVYTWANAKRYWNTDTGMVSESHEYYPYPCLISIGGYSTSLQLKKDFFADKGLKESDVEYIVYELYAQSDGTVTVSINSRNYKYPVTQGYNIVRHHERVYNNDNNVITSITLGTTSKTDVIGKVYIGKYDGNESVLGLNNLEAKYITDIAPKIVKEASESKEHLANIVDAETICLLNNISSMSGLSGVLLWSLYPRRFDSKRYAFYCKTRADKPFSWGVSFPSKFDNVTMLQEGLSHGEESPSSTRYSVHTRIDENTVESLQVNLFANEADYLHQINIQSQQSLDKLDIIDIRVMPVPDYITKPSEIEQMILADSFRMSANSLHSTYADSSGMLKGKKFVLVGDSIANQSTYTPDIIKHTGMRYYRKISAGGAYVRPTGQGNCIYYFVDDIPEDAEFIMFIAGQNDTGLNMQQPRLGTIDDEPFISYDKSEEVEGAATFYAAYKGMLIKTIKRCPRAKIVVCGLVPTWTLTAEGMERMTKIKTAKSDIIKSICELYGIQFIDLIRKCGINWYNAPWMINHDGDGTDIWPDGTAGGPTTDDDGQVHPSPEGGRKCAQVILSEIM